MRSKEFAKTGRKVSEIGMGTYYDPFWVATALMGWRRGGAAKVDSIVAGLDAGITLVDTAEIYGSEPLVARALRGRKRDEVFLATKVWPNHLHRDSLIRSFNKSLKRLGTPYLDLYQVHWPNPRVPIRESMDAMQQLIDEGKLMHPAVSNFNLEQLKEAQSALPKAELASVQLEYSLIQRRVEDGILRFCDEQKVALLAYYPLGHGKLPSDHRLEAVSASHGKSRAQVALRWLAERPNVFPIPRASRAEHVRENSGASDWQLSDEERTDLDTKFR